MIDIRSMVPLNLSLGKPIVSSQYPAERKAARTATSPSISISRTELRSRQSRIGFDRRLHRIELLAVERSNIRIENGGCAGIIRHAVVGRTDLADGAGRRLQNGNRIEIDGLRGERRNGNGIQSVDNTGVQLRYSSIGDGIIALLFGSRKSDSVGHPWP